MKEKETFFLASAAFVVGTFYTRQQLVAKAVAAQPTAGQLSTMLQRVQTLFNTIPNPLPRNRHISDLSLSKAVPPFIHSFVPYAEKSGVQDTHLVTKQCSSHHSG